MHVIVTIVAVCVLLVGAFFSQRKNTNEGNFLEESDVLSEEDVSSVSPQPNNSSAIDQYRYPNATITFSSSTVLKLESIDDSDSITNWYKDKIKILGFNVKTFVNTRANDNVLSKLVAADGETEVRVEIKKNSGETINKIEISVQND